jgi:site-specific recombinase XerC
MQEFHNYVLSRSTPAYFETPQELALAAVSAFSDWEARGRPGARKAFIGKDEYSGVRLYSPRFWFDAAVKEAKLSDFTWHCLRHTFASRLVMAGVDLRTVQELMGLKTIQMTVRYAHLAP